jgi:hypothetical protein
MGNGKDQTLMMRMKGEDGKGIEEGCSNYFLCGVVLYELFVCVCVWLSRGQAVFWLAGPASITDQIEICENRGSTQHTQ